MRDSKRNLIFTALDTCYGVNAPMVKGMILEESKTQSNHERTLFQAATVISSRCSSFLQAQKMVREWVAQ